MDRAWDRVGKGFSRRHRSVETLERVAARAGGSAAAQNSTLSLTCLMSRRTVTSRAEVTDKSPITPTLTVPWASLSFSLTPRMKRGGTL